MTMGDGPGLAAVLSELLAKKSCIRCGGPLQGTEGPAKVIGWDPAGVICTDCWFAEASQDLEEQERRAWQTFQEDMRQLRGE